MLVLQRLERGEYHGDLIAYPSELNDNWHGQSHCQALQDHLTVFESEGSGKDEW